MQIEILYPEISNLYGDSANAMYLKKTLKDATFIETKLNQKPKFLDNKIDLVYIGSCSEKDQEIAISKLLKYKDQIKSKIDSNQLIIATGNSCEIFGKYIIEKGKKVEALNIFDYYSIRDTDHRHNSLFLGEYKNMKIVGNKSQFSFIYDVKHTFIKLLRGIGNNKEDQYEGIHYKNFFATYLLGPFLILNPYFTKYILKIIKYNKKLAFENISIEAYNYRLKELEDEKTSVVSKH